MKLNILLAGLSTLLLAVNVANSQQRVLVNASNPSNLIVEPAQVEINAYFALRDTVSYIVKYDSKDPISVLIGEDCQLVINNGDAAADFQFTANRIGGDPAFVITPANEGRGTVSAGCAEVRVPVLQSPIKIRWQGNNYNIVKQGAGGPSAEWKYTSILTGAVQVALDQVSTKSEAIYTELLSYDVASRTFIIPTKWGSPPRLGGKPAKSDTSANIKTEEKGIPGVGDLVNLRVVNFNPYRHNVIFKVAYNDHYANSQDQFKKLFPDQGKAAGSGQPEGQNTEAPEDDKGASRGEKPDAASLITAFANDLNVLYRDLYARSVIDGEKLSTLLVALDKAIQGAFDIAVVNSASINAKGQELIASIDKADEKAKYTTLLQQGITTYQQLHTYTGNLSASSQIKSMDLVKIEAQVTFDKVVEAESQTIELPIVGGLGFGYSVGFMYSPLRNLSYELLTVERTRPKNGDDLNEPGTETEVVKLDSVARKDEGSFTIGGLALGHVYYRVSTLAYVALSTGFGVKGDLDTYYFVGPSLLAGRQKEFVVTAGLAFGKVNRLGGGLQEGQVFPKGDERSSRITDLRQVSEQDWFVAVSYRF